MSEKDQETALLALSTDLTSTLLLRLLNLACVALTS